MNESLYYKYGSVYQTPESVDPWLDSAGNMRLSCSVKERPGCVVFDVSAKAKGGPSGPYWVRVGCHVIETPLSMEERRGLRRGFLDLMEIKMGRPYILRGKRS